MAFSPSVVARSPLTLTIGFAEVVERGALRGVGRAFRVSVTSIGPSSDRHPRISLAVPGRLHQRSQWLFILRIPEPEPAGGARKAPSTGSGFVRGDESEKGIVEV